MSNFVIDWDNEQTLKDIRDICPPRVTKTEFDNFINQIKTIGANPFTREAYLIKYGDGAAMTVIGRDFYRRVAQSQAEYDYHHVDAVYSNDQFMVSDGEIKHKYDLNDRGKLMGAYCTVKRRNSSKTMYEFTEFVEYNQKKSMWLSKPATMIKKTAEQHALRMAFQAVFEGTYGQDEIDEDELKKEAAKREDTSPKHPKFSPEVSMITEEQVTKIDELMMISDMPYERIQSGIQSIYKKQELHELTEREATNFIGRLEKKIQNEFNKTIDTQVEAETINQSTEKSDNTEEVSTTGSEAN